MINLSETGKAHLYGRVLNLSVLATQLLLMLTIINVAVCVFSSPPGISPAIKTSQ